MANTCGLVSYHEENIHKHKQKHYLFILFLTNQIYLESTINDTNSLTLVAEHFPFWQSPEAHYSPEANDISNIDTKPGGCL